MTRPTPEEAQARLQQKLLSANETIEQLERDKKELERITRDQRLMIEEMQRQAEILSLQRRNGEESARIFHAQCKSAQSDLGSLIAVLNSELDIAYLLWEATPNSKAFEARVQTMGGILKSLNLFDKFNKPRWKTFNATIDALDQPV